MTVGSRLIEVAGGRLEVVDRPAPGSTPQPVGPPILLLHEGLGSVSAWGRFPDQLAAATGRRVVSYSRFGYGRSSPADLPRRPGYMHDEADRVLPELLAALELVDPVLIGHSDGASIALLHAGAGRPASAVVALAPHVVVEDCTVEGAESARDAFEVGDLRAKLERHHADVDAAFRGWNDIWLAPEFRSWSIADRLPGVAVPVLLIQCADDPYGTTGQLDRIEGAVSQPVRRLLLPAGGHAPHRAAPDVVVPAISRFLASAVGRAQPAEARPAAEQPATAQPPAGTGG